MTLPSIPANLPSEEEIRALVSRVVDAVLAVDGEAAHEPADGSADAPAQAPRQGGVVAAVVIAIGADHGGYPLKERLGFRLREAGYEVVDCGTNSTDAVDYPDFAHAVARKVADGEATWGIVVDGAGIGSAIVANKVPGVRAAACYDLSTARNSREHNHANVLTLGAGLVGDGLAWQIVQEWLAVPWGGDRHARRVGLIDEIERRYLGTAEV
jgi:ribose 5-phosphate isomerase B